MIGNRYDDLILTYETDFLALSTILKVLGNETRLKILILLLKGTQSYSSIVNELQLKKTAISNHLNQLLEVNLIKREDYGIYEITKDGLEILTAIEVGYQNFPSREVENFYEIESRKVSESFLSRFST